MAISSLREQSTDIRMPKTCDVLAERIRTQILRDGLQPGTPLPSEPELIETYRVSRATVREALRLLESEGLISIRRGARGGTSVAAPDVTALSRSFAVHLAIDQTTVRSFLEFRKTIEPAIAREVALATSPGEGQELIQLITAETRTGKDSDFHRVLAEMVDNGIFRLLMRSLHAGLELHVPLEVLTTEDMTQQRRAHLKIARRIAANDGDGAADAMLGHLEGFEKILARQGRLDGPLVPRANWGDR
jgi:DNA-binding FadR family transcriptional regulator